MHGANLLTHMDWAAGYGVQQSQIHGGHARMSSQCGHGPWLAFMQLHLTVASQQSFYGNRDTLLNESQPDTEAASVYHRTDDSRSWAVPNRNLTSTTLSMRETFCMWVSKARQNKPQSRQCYRSVLLGLQGHLLHTHRHFWERAFAEFKMNEMHFQLSENTSRM